MSEIFWPFVIGVEGYVVFFNGLFIKSFFHVIITQIKMRSPVIWIPLNHPLHFLDRLIIATCKIEQPANIGTDLWRQAGSNSRANFISLIA